MDPTPPSSQLCLVFPGVFQETSEAAEHDSESGGAAVWGPCSCLGGPAAVWGPCSCLGWAGSPPSPAELPSSCVGIETAGARYTIPSEPRAEAAEEGRQLQAFAPKQLLSAGLGGLGGPSCLLDTRE